MPGRRRPSALRPPNTASDFRFSGERVVPAQAERPLTYGDIGVFSPTMFNGVATDRPLELRTPLHAAIAAGKLTGERFTARWVDGGTPQRPAELDAELCDRGSAHFQT